ncbi:hypothetical protein CGCFRS4_v016128 [Colletotrichum fructicola]|nr:hypothetical protein CGCFRS4_v016128 [Colletotrichum fructicola]
MLSNCRKGKYSSFVGMILLHKMQHVNTIISQGQYSGFGVYVGPRCYHVTWFADRHGIIRLEEHEAIALATVERMQ